MGLPIRDGREPEDGHMVAGRHSVCDDVRRGGWLCDCMVGRGVVLEQVEGGGMGWCGREGLEGAMWQ